MKHTQEPARIAALEAEFKKLKQALGNYLMKPCCEGLFS